MEDDIPISEEEVALVEEIRGERKKANLNQKRLTPKEMEELFVN